MSCGYSFIVPEVKKKRLNGGPEEIKQAEKCTIFAIKLDSDLNFADLVDVNTNVPACTCARVCELVFTPVSDGEMMQRESGGR